MLHSVMPSGIEMTVLCLNCSQRSNYDIFFLFEGFIYIYFQDIGRSFYYALYPGLFMSYHLTLKALKHFCINHGDLRVFCDLKSS